MSDIVFWRIVWSIKKKEKWRIIICTSQEQEQRVQLRQWQKHVYRQQAHSDSFHDWEKLWWLCSYRHSQIEGKSWLCMACSFEINLHNIFVPPFFFSLGRQGRERMCKKEIEEEHLKLFVSPKWKLKKLTYL